MRHLTIFVTLLFLASSEACAEAQSPTPRLRHKLKFQASETTGVYALFDQKAFHTVEALRAAIVALPPGSRIACRAGYADNPTDLKQFAEFMRELPRLCEDKRITFVTLPIGYL